MWATVQRWRWDGRAAGTGRRSGVGEGFGPFFGEPAGVYGSDGTRTRDLRRDRPVMALPRWAGIGGNALGEQGVPSVKLRGSASVGGSFRRRPAGSVRDAVLAQSQTNGISAGCARVAS